SRREYFDKVKRNKPIRTEDYRFLEAVNGDSVLYSPYRNHVSDVKRENLICEDTTILGAAADMASIRDTVRTTLFPGDASPLNQIVRIEGIEFTVIGVEERLGSAFGRDQDKSLYIPITAFHRLS